jgi:2-polyprenyl-3-methyl-5-hydroxy-6-metoxy-1,4-benzoquinol methylase
MISLLQKNKIIPNDIILDFAAGYGTLQNILHKYFSIEALLYDPFVTNIAKRYIKNGDLKKYSIVLNSAMFEHIRNRKDIDAINNLVEDSGCFILHTVVCENIPKDSSWFYLLPVHCAFHTNKSMSILMKQWNYESSLYCPASKCWVLFKKEPKNIEKKILDINVELQYLYLHYKKGFVDYWKGF